MEFGQSIPSPSAHTPEGGVLLGRNEARRRLVVFEDPQCPYCRRFEEASGEMLRSARRAGDVAIEYRMRCFLGIESVRADNALALAAEGDRFDELRRELFEAQPEEGTGGFTTADLVTLGRRVGLTGVEYSSGVEEGRYQAWVLRAEEIFQEQDPQGTPAAWLDGEPVDGRVLTDRRRFGSLLGT
ncbi:MAG: thioredoxin domain-containing protein [Acidimicrobiales bacterium]